MGEAPHALPLVMPLTLQLARADAGTIAQAPSEPSKQARFPSPTDHTAALRQSSKTKSQPVTASAEVSTFEATGADIPLPRAPNVAAQRDASATSVRESTAPSVDPVSEAHPLIASEPAAMAPAKPEESDSDAQEVPESAPSPISVAHGVQVYRFRVFWGDYTDGVSVARLDYRFERAGDRYVIRVAARAQGLMAMVYSGVLTQSSEGRVGVAGLEPERYEEQRGRRPARSVTFDREAGVFRSVTGDAMALPAGTQDRLSVFYQLSALIRADPGRFVAGYGHELPVASMRTVQFQRFDVVGAAVVTSRSGRMRALHLRRSPPAGSDEPQIEVWLGYDFGMLPVRLRVEDAHKRVLDQVIERDP